MGNQDAVVASPVAKSVKTTAPTKSGPKNAAPATGAAADKVNMSQQTLAAIILAMSAMPMNTTEGDMNTTIQSAALRRKSGFQPSTADANRKKKEPKRQDQRPKMPRQQRR